MSYLLVLFSSFGVSGQWVWCRHNSCVCALRQKTWRPAISEWFPFYLRKVSVWAVFCGSQVRMVHLSGPNFGWSHAYKPQRHESSRHGKRGIVMHVFDLKFLEPYNIHVSLCIGSVSWYHLSISMSFTFHGVSLYSLKSNRQGTG